jgi:hypothetical protein
MLKQIKRHKYKTIIKSCSYWNSQTPDAIVDHGNVFYRDILKAVQKLMHNS